MPERDSGSGQTEEATTFDTTPNHPPLYEGNNLGISCLYGSTIDLDDKLGQNFSDPNGDELTITYTTSDSAWQSLISDSTFSCQQVGSFKITAEAEDGRGGKAESKMLSISVYQDSGGGDSGGGGGSTGGGGGSTGGGSLLGGF